MSQPPFDPAPFFADIAEGPEGAKAFWLLTSDNMRIRIGIWGGRENGGDKGTVLLFPGRTEYIEKYGRTAKLLLERGFSTVAIDWRGQGIADRAYKDRPALGHVDCFSDYQKDVAALCEALPQLELARPYGLMAHSMGGCIGLRALMKNPLQNLPVKAAVFTGPMWDIELPPLKRKAGSALSSISRHLGFDHLFAIGTSRKSYILEQPFEGNMLTRDPEFYEYLRRQITTYPELILGGPSFAWVNEAFKECHALSQAPTPDIPCLTFLGSDERIVDKDSIKDRMARWHNGTLHVIEGARHEILMDWPDLQQDVCDKAVALYLA